MVFLFSAGWVSVFEYWFFVFEHGGNASRIVCTKELQPNSLASFTSFPYLTSQLVINFPAQIWVLGFSFSDFSISGFLVRSTPHLLWRPSPTVTCPRSLSSDFFVCLRILFYCFLVSHQPRPIESLPVSSKFHICYTYALVGLSCTAGLKWLSRIAGIKQLTPRLQHGGLLNISRFSCLRYVHVELPLSYIRSTWVILK